MVGNRFFQGNKQWLALDSGETLPFFKMGFWGRQIYKESIERYYKQNPKFRNEVKRAKQTWIDVGKENEKIANSFIDNYKSNKLAKANDYDINNAKKFIDKYKKQVKKYAGVSDTEFATRYLFDDYKNKNRVLFAIDTVMFIREMASILGSDSGN